MQIRQSNSRVIRWSDGTLSLKLGKEIFDITQSVDVSAAPPRQSLGTSQAASQSQTQSSGKSQGLVYLVAQHKRSQVLQAEALITGSMTLQPTGMQSDAHRLLVKAVGQKHNKKARLLLAPDPTFDPEREKMELMKAQAKKVTRRKFESSGRRRRAGRRQAHDFSDDEDADAIFGGSDEEEDDDVVHSSGGRAPKRKRNEDENNKGGDYQEDDFVVADESDEDHDLGGSGRKKGREVDVMADLDKLEAKIEKREGRRKQKGDDKSDDDDADADDDDDVDDDADDGMDVESEEEEEEFKVRRASGRRGRVMAEDEEDE